MKNDVIFRRKIAIQTKPVDLTNVTSYQKKEKKRKKKGKDLEDYGIK